jgi:GNAT superfamily N-acetyltransferase
LDDAARLASLTRETFAGYVTHYHANPRFARATILDGYAEWAASHVRGDRPGARAWLVEWRGALAGFSCCRVDDGGRLAIGVLNGVVPAFRGRGIYGGMLRHMLRELDASGAARFAIATQVQNVTVQRTWAAAGFQLDGACNTVHINAPRAAAGRIEDAPDPV